MRGIAVHRCAHIAGTTRRSTFNRRTMGPELATRCAPPTLTAFETGEDIRRAQVAISTAFDASLHSIAAIPPEERTFDNTVAAFSRALGRASDASASVTLPSMVHRDAHIRLMSSAAKDSLKNMFDETFARHDVFSILAGVGEHAAPDPESARAAKTFLQEFTRKGASASAHDRQTLRTQLADIERLCSQVRWVTIISHFCVIGDANHILHVVASSRTRSDVPSKTYSRHAS